MIKFFNGKNIRPAEIQQLVEIYWEGVMKERNVHKQCRRFNEIRTTESLPGMPTIITEILIKIRGVKLPTETTHE